MEQFLSHPYHALSVLCCPPVLPTSQRCCWASRHPWLYL